MEGHGKQRYDLHQFTYETANWEKGNRPGKPRDPVNGGTVNRGLTVIANNHK